MWFDTQDDVSSAEAVAATQICEDPEEVYWAEKAAGIRRQHDLDAAEANDEPETDDETATAVQEEKDVLPSVTPVAEASDSPIDLWIIIVVAVVILIIIIVLILVCRKKKGEEKADQRQPDKDRKNQYAVNESIEEAEDKTENNDEEAARTSGIAPVLEPEEVKPKESPKTINTPATVFSTPGEVDDGKLRQGSSQHVESKESGKLRQDDHIIKPFNDQHEEVLDVNFADDPTYDNRGEAPGGTNSMMDNSKLDDAHENAPMVFQDENRDHTARAAKVEVVEINE